MKARIFIVRALLFAVVLAPLALRATAKPLSAPSCTALRPQLDTGSVAIKAIGVTEQLVASAPSHRGPTTLHRIRGNKISIERGFASAPRCFARASFLFSAASFNQQDMDGPNPSRGPPSQISL